MLSVRKRPVRSRLPLLAAVLVEEGHHRDPATTYR
jgi:hypothetical protein